MIALPSVFPVIARCVPGTKADWLNTPSGLLKSLSDTGIEWAERLEPL